jgi:hypothetical protein
MTIITVEDHTLAVEMKGADKLWSMRSHIDVPLGHITAVRRDPDETRGFWNGLRGPGTELPGVIKAAGTFYHDGKRIFFDVHDPDGTVIIDLQDEHFDELVVEVDDPDQVLATVQLALAEDSAQRII